MELTIKVVSGGSESLPVHVEDPAQTTVAQLKQLIAQQDPARFPVASQRLIFQGQVLQDAKLVTDYKMQDGLAVHLTFIPGVPRSTTAAAASIPAPRTEAPVASLPIPSQIRAILQQMRNEYGFTTAVQTLQRICDNIINHPNEEKFRKLRKSNAALKARLFDRVRGLEAVQVLGFVEGVEPDVLVLVPNADKWEALVASKRVIDEFASPPTASFAPAAAASPGASAVHSDFASFPTPNGNPTASNFAAQAQMMHSMLQDPAMASTVRNHPMVQQMAQRNPLVGQMLENPAMLSQAMGMMQQNPAMMQQMNQMMQDPNAMQRMQAMIQAGAGGGLPSMSPFGAPVAPPPSIPSSNPFASATNPFAAPVISPPVAVAPAPAPAPAPATVSASVPTPSAPPAPASSTNETTDPNAYDEDEIAAAIARSLEEH